ncbi:MAG: molybdopterin cofactor-binding domain-containing protein [Candidatus Methylumidiphilus sp.]
MLHVGCQGVFGLRGQLSRDLLKVPTEQVRVLTGNVGGSFGMKSSVYPEYVPVLHAAKLLGRPVKWTDDRSGSFVSDQHGRDHEVDAELAFDGAGRFLAVRLTSYANIGGYLATVGPHMATGNYVKNIQSNYATPLIEISNRCAGNRPQFYAKATSLLEKPAKLFGRWLAALCSDTDVVSIFVFMPDSMNIKPTRYPHDRNILSRFNLLE